LNQAQSGETLMAMTTTTLSAEDKIKKAIIGLQKAQPFFAHLLMAMEFRAKEGIPTLRVNAQGKVWFGREFVDKLQAGNLSKDGADYEPGESEGVVIHELLHPVLGHFSRLGAREPQLANIAQDVVINCIIGQNNIPMPIGVIPYSKYDDKSEFDLNVMMAKLGTDGKPVQDVKPIKIIIEEVSKKPWEAVYDEIEQQLDDKFGKGGWGSASSGGQFDQHDRSFEGMTDKEKDAIREQWGERLADAAAYAKQQGKMPMGVERFIDSLLKPEVAWYELLAKYVRHGVTPDDWSYARPARKSHALGVYLPNVVRESCEVEMLIDTSGSIGKDALTRFYSEMAGILSAFSNVKMFVNFGDTEIAARYEFDSMTMKDLVEMTPKGGGGTNLCHSLDQIRERNSTSRVVVVLTDGEDSFRGQAKDYPFDVIWVISENGISEQEMERRIPFGEKVKMK